MIARCDSTAKMVSGDGSAVTRHLFKTGGKLKAKQERMQSLLQTKTV